MAGIVTFSNFRHSRILAQRNDTTKATRHSVFSCLFIRLNVTMDNNELYIHASETLTSVHCCTMNVLVLELGKHLNTCGKRHGEAVSNTVRCGINRVTLYLCLLSVLFRWCFKMFSKSCCTVNCWLGIVLNTARKYLLRILLNFRHRSIVSRFIAWR